MELFFITREDHSDPTSATLQVLDFKELPFVPKRIYWLTDFVEGVSRGNHAHKNLTQAMIMLQGSIDLKLSKASESVNLRFSDKDGYLILPPGYWREMKNASQDALLLVLADDIYKEEDYIRNKTEYLEWCAGQ